MDLYTLNPTDAQRAELVDNIITAYDAASDDQLMRGFTWYDTAHDLAKLVGHGDTRMGAGVIAALSANVGWGQNRKMALVASNGGAVKGLPLGISKACRIMSGADPLDVLAKSLKTRSFFLNIADPSMSEDVTIDRHAHDVAVGQRYGAESRGLTTATRYMIFARAYTEAAERITARNPRAGRIMPHQVQATTWVHWTETVTPERYRRP